ncbi:unnamed protein product [Meloidogyne enterolobii]|uniref:Uncharacterized protein n=1 Tax=Meloidogyne enterolobii TaxID=390850 RepID=A0ACB0ZE79_MELEN
MYPFHLTILLSFFFHFHTVSNTLSRPLSLFFTHFDLKAGSNLDAESERKMRKGIKSKKEGWIDLYRSSFLLLSSSYTVLHV